eukprot:gene16737-19896_t
MRGKLNDMVHETDRFDLDKIIASTEQTIFDSCDRQLLDLLIIICGIKDMDLFDMDPTYPTRKFYLAHAIESLSKAINLNYTGIIGKSICLTVYFLSNSPTITSLAARLAGVSMTTVINYMKQVADAKQFVAPPRDIVLSFDNIQKFKVPSIKTEKNHAKMQYATTITVFVPEVYTRLQFNDAESLSVKPPPPTDTKSAFHHHLHTDIRASHQPQSSYGKTFKWIDQNPHTKTQAKTRRFEKRCQDAQDTNILGILPLNPSSREAVEEVLAYIKARVIVNGRKWVLLVVDGGPYMIVRSLQKKHPELYSWLILRCGLLHEEMNMLKVINTYIWSFVGKTLTSKMDSFKSCSSYLENCSDHHQSYHFYNLVRDQIVSVMWSNYAKVFFQYNYGLDCQCPREQPCSHGFLEYGSSFEDDVTFHFIFHFFVVHNYSLRLFRKGVRSGDQKMISIARNTFAPLFFANGNHTYYRVITDMEQSDHTNTTLDFILTNEIFPSTMTNGERIFEGIDARQEERQKIILALLHGNFDEEHLRIIANYFPQGYTIRQRAFEWLSKELASDPSANKTISMPLDVERDKAIIAGILLPYLTPQSGREYEHTQPEYYYPPSSPTSNINNQSIQLAPTKDEHIDTILFPTNSRIEPYQQICWIGPRALQREDVWRLAPGQWLNDSVINFYFQALDIRQQQHVSLPRCLYLPCSFYLLLSNQDTSHLNSQKNHWCLVVINLKKRRCEYYDSLSGDNSKTGRICIDKLALFVEDHQKNKHPLSPYTGIKTFRKMLNPSCPRQTNAYDCG